MYFHSWRTEAAEKRKAMSLAQQRLERIRPHFAMAIATGHGSCRQIAAYLNSRGICTSKGREWCGSQVFRTMRRLDESRAQLAIGVVPADSVELFKQLCRAKAAGCKSLREIATYLNTNGILTPRGRKWHAIQISRLLRRYQLDVASRDPRHLEQSSAKMASDPTSNRQAVSSSMVAQL